MKTQVLHTVWCIISGEAAGEIWNWSLMGVKWLTNTSTVKPVLPAGHTNHQARHRMYHIFVMRGPLSASSQNNLLSVCTPQRAKKSVSDFSFQRKSTAPSFARRSEHNSRCWWLVWTPRSNSSPILMGGIGGMQWLYNFFLKISCLPNLRQCCVASLEPWGCSRQIGI